MKTTDTQNVVKVLHQTSDINVVFQRTSVALLLLVWICNKGSVYTERPITVRSELNTLTLVVAVAGDPSTTGSLVTCTPRYGLSMRGHAPRTRHVWYSFLNVLRCGSPNKPQCLDRCLPWYGHSRFGAGLLLVRGGAALDDGRGTWPADVAFERCRGQLLSTNRPSVLMVEWKLRLPRQDRAVPFRQAR
jgi:hypothetical protein